MNSVKLTNWTRNFDVVLDGKNYFVHETDTTMEVSDENQNAVEEEIEAKIIEMVKREFGDTI